MRSNALDDKLGAALPARAVLSISPTAKSSAPLNQTASSIKLSADMQQYVERKDWNSLYERLRGGPATAEALYIQAELLDKCARRDQNVDPAKFAEARALRREKFISGLTGTESARQQRIAAFDSANADHCGALRTIVASEPDIAKLRAAAMEAGDPRAKAWQLALDVKAASEAEAKRLDALSEGADSAQAQVSQVRGLLVSDEAWASIQQLLKTRDPLVINEMRNLLASTWINSSLVLGQNNEQIDSPALRAAVALVACDLGASCDGNHITISNACAFQGRCGASNLQDYTYFFDASPYQAQLIDQYRQELGRMLASGDLSGLRVVRGSTGQRNVYFWSGR